MQDLEKGRGVCEESARLQKTRKHVWTTPNQCILTPWPNHTFEWKGKVKSSEPGRISFCFRRSALPPQSVYFVHLVFLGPLPPPLPLLLPSFSHTLPFFCTVNQKKRTMIGATPKTISFQNFSVHNRIFFLFSGKGGSIESNL